MTLSSSPPGSVATACRAPVLALRKALGRTLRQGHPWVYRDAFAHPPRLPSGALAAVAEDAEGPPIAWGYWDSDSPIALRVLELLATKGAPRVIDRAAATTLVRERLEDTLHRRLERLDLTRTNAFRWVHGEADGLPGIHVDVYATAATIRYDGDGARAFYAEAMALPDRLREVGRAIGLAHVVERRRRHQQTAPRSGTLPEAEPPLEPFTVRENGLLFAVDLIHGQKGGLFLDQRENRARMAPLAVGKRVLNLFGYTGGFSVYAAAAGAAATDTVDIAATAMTAAAQNFALNGLSVDRAGFHAVDAFDFLGAAVARGETWDIVISDPPSFAPSHKALDAALASYRKLHEAAAQVVAPGGLLAAASCSSHVERARFMETVHAGVARAGRRFELQAYAGAGFDHPVLPSFPEGDYLKFALGRISHAAKT